MLFDYLHAKGAYGRKYSLKDTDKLLEDYKEGKDFKIVNGPYFSIRDEQMLKKDYHLGIMFHYENGILVHKFN